MHVSSALRQTPLAALLDLWAWEGFQVPPHLNGTFRMLCELAELPDDMRKRLGVAEHQTAQRYYPK
jgi:hypothetical protein